MPPHELPLRPPRERDAGDAYLGAAFGGLGAMLLAFLMVPLRDHIPNANMALALVIPVLLGAIVGGRVAGVFSAIVAALSFNFVFTQPYLSLRISSGDDIATFVVLTIVSLIAAELGTRARRGGIAARQSRSEVDRLYRIAALAATDANTDYLVEAARTELIGLFGLDDCVYERDTSGVELPRLGERGALEQAPLVAVGEFLLPTGGIEVTVHGRGRSFGRLVLHARELTRAPLEKRLVAVAIADELGVALAGTSL